MKVGSRRGGATMSGSLNLSSGNVFSKGEALDKAVNNNHSQSMYSNRKNTLAYNLDIFKVTRSDDEDLDCLVDSDQELMIDIENIFQYSKKISSTTLEMTSSPTNKRNSPTTQMEELYSRRD